MEEQELIQTLQLGLADAKKNLSSPNFQQPVNKFAVKGFIRDLKAHIKHCELIVSAAESHEWR